MTVAEAITIAVFSLLMYMIGKTIVQHVRVFLTLFSDYWLHDEVSSSLSFTQIVVVLVTNSRFQDRSQAVRDAAGESLVRVMWFIVLIMAAYAWYSPIVEYAQSTSLGGIQLFSLE